MKTYHKLSHIQKDLDNNLLTLRDLVLYYLDKIEQNAHLNAFLEVFKEEAISRADQLDSKIRKKKFGKLLGLVIGIKDLICYKDHKISASSKILEGFTSIYSSTVVKRLLEEDAIIIGRLNCDEFGMGSSNENSAYGPVLNFLDNSKVSGGSSGGCAVAVQANLCHATLGSDTGGSIRQPASFCGVIGLKPTYGRVSRHGLIAYASSFDQIGAFTRSIDDVASILGVISGKDEFDNTVADREVPTYNKLLKTKSKASIAYFQETLTHPGLDNEIRGRMENLFIKLDDAGHNVSCIDFPYLNYIVPAYYVLTTAEASSNLARYDGVHYGYRNKKAKEIETVYTASRNDGLGKEVKRRIMLGTFVLSAGYYDAYYSKAQKVRRIIYENALEIFKDHDYIMMPVSPTTAFGIGEKTKDPIEMYLSDIYTVMANLAGLPAISLPLGKHSNSLPFGIQMIAAKFKEEKLLAFSKYLMDEFGE